LAEVGRVGTLAFVRQKPSRHRSELDRVTGRKALLAQLESMETVWRARLDEKDSGLAALEPLRGCVERLRECLADEAEHIHPLVQAYLPTETGTMEAIADEHTTLRGLVTLLADGLSAYSRSEPGAETTVGVALHDLVDVWRTHVRRFDRALAPLLRRLEVQR
jgi:hemerythrin-like domain-containing protein